MMNTKFGTNVSNRMLLNAAKFQGYSFYCFWVITGKPTGGVKLPPSHQIRVKYKFQKGIFYSKFNTVIKTVYFYRPLSVTYYFYHYARYMPSVETGPISFVSYFSMSFPRIFVFSSTFSLIIKRIFDEKKLSCQLLLNQNC